MKKIISNNIFLFALILISAILCMANYDPGTILSGWDTLHPEFNFSDYFGRIFFGVWQQHQGLGALATQTHASEISRMFIYYPLHFILPQNFLRYAYFFITIISGIIGSYFFLKKIIFKDDTHQNKIASFCGALIYLLNLAILQQYYVPFEMFATHFATLPFIFLFTLEYLEHNKNKALIWFSLTVFFSASIAHTATLWFVFFFLIVIFLIIYNLFRKNKNVVKKSLYLIILLLMINAFWLLPSIYFLLTEGSTINLAKITSLFSEEAFAQNATFGTLGNLALFKNFLFNWKQLSYTSETFTPLLRPWIEHLNQPLIIALGYFYFITSLIGIFYAIKRKHLVSISLLGLFLICVFFWFNINPPFGVAYSFLLDKLPILKEALRFPFTKFSIVLVFTFSLYFAWGIYFYTEYFKNRTSRSLAYFFIPWLILISLIFYMFPAFKGNFIDQSMRVKIPNEYYSMFKWFEKQDQGRVVEFPIQSFWGWQYYKWGYQGAGFLWFGIKQPLLDREFDRWNPLNEQYYREMSQAVYAKNQKQFNQVLEKYDIKYILLDKNIIASESISDPKVLFHDEIINLINNNGDYGSLNKFSNDLLVYSKNKHINKQSESEVSLLINPVAVSPQSSSYYNDFAFTDNQNYITEKNQENENYYLLRNFIDNQNRLLPKIKIENNGLTFNMQAKLGKIETQDFQKTENLLPANLLINKNANSLNLKVYPLMPIENLTNFPNPIAAELGIKDDGIIININNSQTYTVENITNQTPLSLGEILLASNSENVITAYPLDPDLIIKPDFSSVKYALEPCNKSYTEVSPVFGIGNISLNNFSIFAKKTQVCMTIPLDNILGNVFSQSGFNQNMLLTLSLKASSVKSSSICLTQLNKAGCLYYFSKNLNDLQSNSRLTLERFGIGINQINNLGIRIYFDNTNNPQINTLKVDDFTIGITKPSDTISIDSSTVASSLSNVKIGKAINYNVHIPFTGISELSANISNAPTTLGDCISENPKGASPTNKSIKEDKTSQYVRYSSDEGSFCDHFSYQNLPHNQAYLVSIVSRNIKGLPIRLCISNYATGRCDLYTHLSRSLDFVQDTFFLPPTDNQSGYDINLNNFAVNRLPSVNDIKSINIVPFPYFWLSNLAINNNPTNAKTSKINLESVSHPNQSVYVATIKAMQTNSNNVLTLSQAYHSGWTAFRVSRAGFLEQVFPFFFGSKLENHVLVNNWQNGWKLPSDIKDDDQIIIVFLPQYLEYLGFIVLLLALIILVKTNIKLRKPASKIE